MRGFIKRKKGGRVGGKVCERQQHTGADSIAETTVNILWPDLCQRGDSQTAHVLTLAGSTS